MVGQTWCRTPGSSLGGGSLKRGKNLSAFQGLGASKVVLHATPQVLLFSVEDQHPEFSHLREREREREISGLPLSHLFPLKTATLLVMTSLSLCR